MFLIENGIPSKIEETTFSELNISTFAFGF